VYDIVERHGIVCGLRRCGWLNAAVDDIAFRRQASRAEQWRRCGAPVRVVERAAASALLGTHRYRGALLDERAGALNPLAYARGLAAAAQRFRARVHGGSKVRSLVREVGRWRISTEAGSVTADQVVLATNGYTDRLWPSLAEEIIPIHSLQVATRPLAENVRKTLLPGGHVVSDTQRVLIYFRLDDSGRLVMGGRGSFGATNRDSLYPFVVDAAYGLLLRSELLNGSIAGRARWRSPRTTCPAFMSSPRDCGPASVTTGAAWPWRALWDGRWRTGFEPGTRNFFPSLRLLSDLCPCMALDGRCSRGSLLIPKAPLADSWGIERSRYRGAHIEIL